MSSYRTACASMVIPLLLAVSALAQKTPTTVALTSSTNPSTFGHPVTLKVVVSPANASGTVTFYDGTTMLEIVPLSNGQATFTTVLLAADVQPLKAYYGGDATHAPSTSAVLTQTVNVVPDGSFQPLLSTPINASSPVVGDFNGDGKPDLAFSDNAGGIDVLLGNGDGTFESPVDYATPANYGGYLSIGDFNGDGRPDLVVSSSGLFILFGKGDGTFQNAVEAPILVPGALAVADLNGDGKADLVIVDAQNNSGSVYLGYGDGTFAAPLIFGTSTQPTSIAIGDFNGDGKPDLAVTNWNSTDPVNYVDVLLGNGDGTFRPALIYPAGNGSYAVTTGDFNGDGRADLAVANFGGNAGVGSQGVSILLGNGDGTFQPALSYPDSDYLNSVTETDLNGDGRADLIVAGVNVSVLLGNGDGTFQAPVVYSAFYLLSYSPVVADFNGDGRPDVIVDDEGAFGIFLGASNGSTTGITSSLNPSTFGQKVTLSATISPLSATGVVSFYDQDGGLADVAVQNGVAALTITTLPSGTDSIKALYKGDANYPKSISAVFTQTVNQVITITGLTSSPNPSKIGQAVTFVATVSPTTAQGTVTFYRESGVLGTSTLSNGTAYITTSTLPEGSHSILADYNGNANFKPSRSPARIQKVE